MVYTFNASMRKSTICNQILRILSQKGTNTLHASFTYMSLAFMQNIFSHCDLQCMTNYLFVTSQSSKLEMRVYNSLYFQRCNFYFYCWICELVLMVMTFTHLTHSLYYLHNKFLINKLLCHSRLKILTLQEPQE